MKRSGHIWIIVWALGSAIYSEFSAVRADTLLATDKELKLNVPVLTNALPVQLGSSLSTQYAADYTPDPSAGMLRLETLTFEEGVRYPSLWGGIYSGNAIGEKLMPSLKEGFPMANPNSAYLTSWLNKQWASVNLSLSHFHQLEKPDDQLALGVSRALYVFQNSVCLSVGESIFNEIETRYWSRTTDLSLAYRWKTWDVSLSLEQRQDPQLSSQSVWTAVKMKF